MSQELRRLPDSELEVMQAVWSADPPAERADIEAVLAGRGRTMAQTTLLTLLSRLSEKGYVKIEKQGRRRVYLPLVERSVYQGEQSRRFVDKVFGGSISAFASALCDSALTREEIDELRRLLGRDEL